MVYLPQELVDTVIDYLSDNRLSLLSCALVNPSWLHSTRYHLFSHISLSPHHTHAPSTAAHSNIPPQKLCQRLYQVVQDNPTIVSYIRYLQVMDGGPPPNQRSGQWIATERTLPPLLKLLNHLRQFELGASSSGNVLQWKTLPFTLQNAVCTLLKKPTLTFFRLHSWTFPNLVSLASVLSSCQNLKGLSLSSVTVCEVELDHLSISLPPQPPQPPLVSQGQIQLDTATERTSTSSGSECGCLEDHEETTADPRVPTPRLEALTLDYVNFGYLGYWLFGGSDSPSPSSPSSPSPINFGNLRELRISHSADPFVVEQVLLSIGPSLEYLHLKPGHWDLYPFDLRNNPNLKSLRLTLEVPESALNWCTTLLSTLSSSPSLQLTNVSFEFWTDLKKLSSSSASSSSPPSPSSSSSTLPSTPESQSQSPSQSTPLPPTRRNSHPPTAATWTLLTSLLTLLPAHNLQQIDIGLFAQSTSQDFVRVKEVLGGIRSRSSGASNKGGGVDDGSSVEKEEEQEKRDGGIVRVYQLGLKSQRSLGKVSQGPRLRCFEGMN